MFNMLSLHPETAAFRIRLTSLISIADPTHLLSRLAGFYQRRTIRFNPAVFLVQVCAWISHSSAGQYINLTAQAKASTLLLAVTTRRRPRSPARPAQAINRMPRPQLYTQSSRDIF